MEEVHILCQHTIQYGSNAERGVVMSSYLDDTYWFPLWSNELNRYMTKEDWDNMKVEGNEDVR